MNNTFFIMDEFHLALSRTTQRTASVQRLMSVSRGFLGLSGTPVLNDDIYELSAFLQQVVPFHVTAKNFFVAYSYTVNQGTNTNIVVHDELIETEMPRRRKYIRLLPVAFGGEGPRRLEASDVRSLLNMEIDNATDMILETVIDNLDHRCQVVVAKDSHHASKIVQRLIDMDVMESRDIYLMRKATDVITFTPETLLERSDDRRVKEYKVIVVPLKINAGYSLTVADIMITGVYESNAASRLQIRGRINRLGSSHTAIHYITIVGGKLQ